MDVLSVGNDATCLCPYRRTTPEKFYIEACDDGCVDVLAIDRVSTEMTLTGDLSTPEGDTSTEARSLLACRGVS